MSKPRQWKKVQRWGTGYANFGRLSTAVHDFAEKHGVDPLSVRVNGSWTGRVEISAWTPETDEEYAKRVSQWEREQRAKAARARKKKLAEEALANEQAAQQKAREDAVRRDIRDQQRAIEAKQVEIDLIVERAVTKALEAQRAMLTEAETRAIAGGTLRAARGGSE